MNAIESSRCCFAGAAAIVTEARKLLDFVVDLIRQLGSTLSQMGSYVLRKAGFQQENYYMDLMQGVESDAPVWQTSEDSDDLAAHS